MASFTILHNPVLVGPGTPSALSPLNWSLREQQGPLSFWQPGVTTSGFVVPPGVNHVEVFANIDIDFSGGVDMLFQLLRNGNVVSERIADDHARFQLGCPFGVIAVTAGDILTVRYQTFVSGTQGLVTPNFSRLAICTLDRQGLLSGITTGSVSIASSGFSAPVWSMELDTMLAFSGPSDFVVPEGVTAAIVCSALRSTTFGPGGAFATRLLQNGVEIQRVWQVLDRWFGSPPCFGVVPVTPGDVLRVEAIAGAGSPRFIDNARANRVSIEWLATDPIPVFEAGIAYADELLGPDSVSLSGDQEPGVLLN